MLDRDIRSLYRTGLFEFIEVKTRGRSMHRRFNLVVEVTPKFRVLECPLRGQQEGQNQPAGKRGEGETEPGAR